MSFRRRTGNYLRPVNTLKHIVDNQGGLIGGTPVTVNLAKALDDPTFTISDEVNIGSHVKSIFLNIQVAASSTAALANVYFMIYGNPGQNIGVGSIPNANVVGTDDFRKMVFHQEMLMTEKNTTAMPRTLFRGVIRVPRKFNRMGIKDTIAIQLFSPGVTYDYCLQAIYKEIR